MRLNLVFLLVCLFSCDIYTVKNNYKEDILAGEVVLSTKQCVEFFDFPLIGDFPIRFKYKDPNHLISDKLHPPGHYEISKSGAILKKKSACSIDIIGPKIGVVPQISDSLKTQEPSQTLLPTGDKKKSSEIIRESAPKLDPKPQTKENIEIDL